MSEVLDQHGLKVLATEDERAVQAFSPKRSHDALADGVRWDAPMGVRMTSMPWDSNTASKLARNLASRSQMRKRDPENRPTSSRARCVTHAPPGFGGHPAQVDPSPGQLHEDEHVEAAEQHRVHGQKVAGQGAFGLEVVPLKVEV